jgi:hyperosmotically inducible protein
MVGRSKSPNVLAVAIILGAVILNGCKPPAEDVSTSGPVGPIASANEPAPPATTMPPEPAPSTNASADASAGDSKLASRIEAALAAETALHGSSIGVTAVDGIVTLTGSTRSHDLRSMAAQIALSIDGVKLVRNELAIARET